MIQWIRQKLSGEPAVTTSIVAVLVLCAIVAYAALFPLGSGRDTGTWQTSVAPEDAVRALLVEYTAENGSLKLMRDPNEFEDVLRNPAQKRFVAAHMRKFNRHVAGRRFTQPGLIKGPRDCLFSVALNTGAGGLLYGQLELRDLSMYNLYPVGQRVDKQPGPIHFSPEDIPQPYFTDGHLGFFLDPEERDINQAIPLYRNGIYSVGSVTLTDREGLPRARVRASEDGHLVEVDPLGDRAVFLENNPPVAGSTVSVQEAQVAEIGGRFFEAIIEDSATMAATRQKGDSVKRVYPMGELFHIVGPMALDGAHQSLGIEYMFQEYLMGAPEKGIPRGEIWLTIQRKLQAQLSAGVDELANFSKRGTASALIMDAHHGDILAMAALPNRYNPEDRAAVLDILSRGREAWYNHGCFRRHVIGSVTKSFYAFAALQVMGDSAADLMLEANAPTTQTLFGHNLYGDPKKALKIKHGEVTFPEYLIRSDNTFQHSLGLLLMAGVQDPLTELEGRWIRRGKRGQPILRPLSPEGAEHLAAGNLGERRNRLRVDDTGLFAEFMKNYFELSTAPGTGIAHDRDIGIYGSLIDTAARVMTTRDPSLNKVADILQARSVICAPESPRMILQEVKNTMDASNVLYGGNRNLWTDVKLCEAFSRMMTGKRVKARLISRYQDTLTGQLVDLEQQAQAELQDLPMPNPHASTILRGILERVPMKGNGKYPQGTAHLLHDTVRSLQARYPGFKLIGKTGTIDDGRRGDPDSRLFLGTFGIANDQGFTNDSYTFVIYLKNAVDEEAHFRYINKNLPQWWEQLYQRRQRTAQTQAEQD